MMESVLAELYDALAQLRYPEIAKIEPKDLATSVLTGQNRITLLAWLLSHASPTLSSHIEKFQGNSLKDEVIKCYLQMGIASDENMLLGNCSTKQQISTLKALLLFAKSLDNTDETTPVDDSAIYEVLDKHIKETINIIPPTCLVSMKLTDSEAKKYLEEVKAKVPGPICETQICNLSVTAPVTVEDKIDSGNGAEIENEQIASLNSVAEAFSAAFESAEVWGNSKSSDNEIRNAVNMDETIQNLSKDLSSIAQVFESKRAISATKAPKCLYTCETPLSLLIEDNVICSEEIKRLYDQDRIEN